VASRRRRSRSRLAVRQRASRNGSKRRTETEISDAGIVGDDRPLGPARHPARGLHKASAKQPGIPFRLTFEEWWAPWRLPTRRRLALPQGRPAFSLSRRNSRATYAPAPAGFPARESQRASHRAAFGMPGRAGKARSAAVVGPCPLSPKEGGGRPADTLGRVVTAAEPQARLQQARLRRACVRAAPHVADGAWRAGAGGVPPVAGVSVAGSQRRGSRSGPRLLRSQSAPSAVRGPMRLQGSARAPFGATCRCS
jgi:hypothetical protein